MRWSGVSFIGAFLVAVLVLVSGGRFEGPVPLDPSARAEQLPNVLPASALSASSCSEREQQLRESRTLVARLDALVALRQDCWTSSYDAVLSRTIDTAMELVRSDPVNVDGQADLLRRIVQLDGLNWQALRQLAILEFDAENWAAAARYATSALLEMPASVNDPDLARIAEDLVDVRDAARELNADFLSPPPATRSGNFRGKHRGELALRVMQEPVEFEDDSVVPTAKGRRALQQLVENLRTGLSASSTGAVSILGHTDERGPADYNCDLSRRRAEAVRDELARAGLLDGLEVHVVPQGEQSPRRSERTDRLSVERRQQLDRRVKWAPRVPSPRERTLCEQPRERNP